MPLRMVSVIVVTGVSCTSYTVTMLYCTICIRSNVPLSHLRSKGIASAYITYCTSLPKLLFFSLMIGRGKKGLVQCWHFSVQDSTQWVLIGINENFLEVTNHKSAAHL